MKIAMAQMSMSASLTQNLEKALTLLTQAKQAEADLIVYPELTLPPFFPQYEKRDATAFLTASGGPEIQTFQAACRKHEIHAVPNFYLLEADGRRSDASVLIGPDGQVMGVQRMVHIAQAESFYEQDYYAPGDGFHVFSTPFGKLAIVVYFDRHYPESIRAQSLDGADLILIPTANTTAEPLELFAWEVRAQAFQSCVPIVMCNRVGMEDQMIFAGQSLAVDVNGGLLCIADGSEQLLYAEIDLSATAAVKRERPYLSLRQTQWYL